MGREDQRMISRALEFERPFQSICLCAPLIPHTQKTENSPVQFATLAPVDPHTHLERRTNTVQFMMLASVVPHTLSNERLRTTDNWYHPQIFVAFLNIKRMGYHLSAS